MIISYLYGVNNNIHKSSHLNVNDLIMCLIKAILAKKIVGKKFSERKSTLFFKHHKILTR